MSHKVVKDREVAGTVLLPEDGLIGDSPVMRELREKIARAALADLSVLITGETGTGKELVARALWAHSRRAAAPFVVINCAGLSETLLDSELFGHEKGAFTGADECRPGKFECARGGTMFLDEVGDSSLAMQAKLLRVLQDGTLQRVGGRDLLRFDFRLIAATNRNLHRRIAQGKFRQDLLERLAGYEIRLAPLRRRIADLPLLVNHFLRRMCEKQGRAVPRVSAEAMSLLESYRWPRNVRELDHVLGTALVDMNGAVLLPEALPGRIRRPASTPEVGSDAVRYVESLLDKGPPTFNSLHADLDRDVIAVVLRRTNGNRDEAAQFLHTSRTTLWSKMNRPLDPPKK
jgi:DNA-binding NtrC family response regulator